MRGWAGHALVLGLLLLGAGLTSHSPVEASGPSPANDDFADRTALTSFPVSKSGLLDGATTEPDEPAACEPLVPGSVWYELVADRDGTLVIDVADEHVVSTYTGTTLASLVQLGCASQVYVPATLAHAVNDGDRTLVQIGGYYQPVPFDLDGQIMDPPANDDLAHAEAMPSFPGSVSVTVPRSATQQPSEDLLSCGHATQPSIWYTATAPADGLIRFSDTEAYNQFYDVYEGPDMGNLVALGCHDRPTCDRSCEAIADARVEPGDTVVLRVAVRQDQPTELGFTSAFFPALAHDDFANSTAVTTFPTSDSFHNAPATLEASEPLPSCRPYLDRSVWYTVTSAEPRVLEVTQTGPNYARRVAAYTGSDVASLTEEACAHASSGTAPITLVTLVDAGVPVHVQAGGSTWKGGQMTVDLDVHAIAANDDLADAVVVSDLNSAHDAFTHGTTLEAGESNSCGSTGSTVWWSFTPAARRQVTVDTVGSDFDTLVGVFTGSDVASLTEVACNDDGAGSGMSKVQFQAEPGTTYHVQAGGFDGAVGTLRLALSSPVPPSNDDLADAVTVSEGAATIYGSTVGATTEPSEPFPCGDGAASVWYRLVPSGPGLYRLHTTRSDHDTVIAVFEGETMAALTDVACDDDGAGGGHASVLVDADLGAAYFVQVAGARGETGAVGLDIRLFDPPANDAFAAGLDLGALPANVDASTEHATIESGEPAPCGDHGASVWYRFSTARSEDVRLRTDGSDHQHVLAVFEGSDLETLTAVGCAVASAYSNKASVRFITTPGTTYHVQLASYPGTYGGLALAALLDGGQAPPAHDLRDNARHITALPFVHATSTLGSGLEDGEPQPCGNIGATVWYTYTHLTAPQLVVVSTVGSSFPTAVAAYASSSGVSAPLTCAEDTGTGSSATFVALPGVTYELQVGGMDGARGNLDVSVLRIV